MVITDNQFEEENN